MSSNIGETICRYRQNRRMTQEEFASRLGLTPQAVSKWERGNGLPDASLMEGICSVLGIKADTLLGMEEKVVENGNPIDDREIKNQLIAEPVMVDNLKNLYPGVADGLVPEQISYMRVEQKIKELLQAGENIKDLINIVEGLELEIME